MAAECAKPVVWRVIPWCRDVPSRVSCPDHLNLICEEFMSQDDRVGAAVQLTHTSRDDLACGQEETET